MLYDVNISETSPANFGETFGIQIEILENNQEENYGQ
jgi:hypothetical protein